ncbi:hypothetical protein PMAYCL1PPCAC_24717 [Pristionchus mayeri]|uniref:Uncharacterized protein n=1 Tax=Pristionchus mayeri TaxID=1317129 RepID=A0AAN5I6M9_9BILA|nr:hypothetical protein PMAYCL1PPCAC_24717 [Pristionchus mayeri]
MKDNEVFEFIDCFSRFGSDRSSLSTADSLERNLQARQGMRSAGSEDGPKQEFEVDEPHWRRTSHCQT